MLRVHPCSLRLELRLDQARRPRATHRLQLSDCRANPKFPEHGLGEFCWASYDSTPIRTAFANRRKSRFAACAADSHWQFCPGTDNLSVDAFVQTRHCGI